MSSRRIWKAFPNCVREGKEEGECAWIPLKPYHSSSMCSSPFFLYLSVSSSNLKSKLFLSSTRLSNFPPFLSPLPTETSVNPGSVLSVASQQGSTSVSDAWLLESKHTTVEPQQWSVRWSRSKRPSQSATRHNQASKRSTPPQPPWLGFIWKDSMCR